MSGRHDIDSLLAAPGASATDRDSVASLWTAEGIALWGSEVGAAMVARAGAATRSRIAQLAQANSPIDIARLERLRFGGQLLTCACRRVALAQGGIGLLVVAAAPVPAAWRQPRAITAHAPTVADVEPVAAEDQPLDHLRVLAAQRPTLRFVWTADATGRFTAISPELEQALGASPQRLDKKLLGKTWAEIAEGHVEDVTDSSGVADVAAGLAGRKSWSGATVRWRVGDSAIGVAIELGGMPAGEGQRGFGLIRLRDEAPMASALIETGQHTAQRPEETAEQIAGEPAEASRVVPFRLPHAAPLLLPSETAERGRDTMALHEPQPAPPRHRPTAPLTRHPRASLSPGDRQTLREIARALGARLDGEAGHDADSKASAAASHPALPPITAQGRLPLATPASTERQSALQTPGGSVETRPEAEPAPAHQLPAPAQAPLADIAQPEVTANSAPGLKETRKAEPARDVPVDRPIVQPAHEPLLREPLVAEPLAAEPLASAPPAQEPLASALPAAASSAQRDVAVSGTAAAAASLSTSAGMTLLERLPLAVIVSRGERPLYANRAFLALTHYPSVAAIARVGLDTLFGGRIALADGSARLTLVTADGIEVPVETELASTDWLGSAATVISARRATVSTAEQRIGVLETELAKRELREAELTAILDTATDGVIVLDERGRILTLNRSAEALFGYDQSEVAGESLGFLLAPESHGLAFDYLDGLRSGGVASLLNDGREVMGRVRQGGLCPLFMTLGRVGDGPDVTFCAVLRDITSWKKAEGELLESKRFAERVSANKSEFLAKMSHEVRTPLNAMLGFAEVMLQERFGPIGNERYREYVRDIHASGSHVIHLVNDLLDLAKIEAGRPDLHFDSVNLNRLAMDCVALMQPQANRACIVLRTSLAPKLPGVVADERAMRQVILNVLSNAVKFTEAGGQVIMSTVLTEHGEVALRIRDTGIGMNEAEIKAALEPFRQHATTRREFADGFELGGYTGDEAIGKGSAGKGAIGNSGLGLPLSKALVEANRGVLTITSKPGDGTLVEVLMPPTRVLAE